MDKEQVKDKAGEQIRLPRFEVWLLRIAAATGAFSAISHGADAIGQLGKVLGWLS